MKIFFVLFSVFIVITLAAPKANCQDKPSSVGDVLVKKWKDDKTAAFSFTFDDCMQSQYDYVFPMFEEYGFRGTFFLITQPLDDPYGPYWRYGTWPEFIEMSDAGQEMGSHTVTHPHLNNLDIGDTSTAGTLLYELYQSRKRIEQKIPDKKCIVLAYPYSEYDSDVVYNTSLFYESARAISVDPEDSSLWDLDWYTIGSRVITFDSTRNSPSDDLDELQDFYDYVDNSISQGGWGLLQAHDVIPFDSIQSAINQGSYEPISVQWFDSACQYVSDASDNGDLWVAPMGEVTRYMKERDSYDYNIVSVTDTSIIINLTDTLENDIYNYPLTADIVVPNGWTDVTVIQGSYFDYTASYLSGTNTVIETSVIPDGGQIRLYKGPVTDVKNIANTPADFCLYQNYPNPFNPSTKINFTIPTDGYVTLKIYNSLGEEVNTLAENEYYTKGAHSLDLNGKFLPSGAYYYRLSSGSYSAVKKMLLIK
jgi:peptidoglycan/xylan/chitin deacetylase (PgdA/CDA1 family)